LFHSSFEHIHRTSSHPVPCRFDAIFYGQNSFGIFGGDAEDSRQPHPEHGARAACGDRCRDTNDVAGADGSREGSRQRAELAYVALAFVRSLNGQFDRLADVSLNEAKSKREKNVRAEQKNQQRRSPDKIAELSDKFFKFLHKTLCLSGKKYRVPVGKAREKMPPLKKNI
jgi:hypothetical protein